jgi:transposase
VAAAGRWLIHGAKAKNDRVDSHKLAVLLRGGVIPQADVYNPEMRPTRDLLRRRLSFSRRRAELLTHIQNTFHQYSLPPPPRGRMIHASHRQKIADCFQDQAIRRSIEADLQLCEFYDPLIRDLEKTIERLARGHDPHSLFLLRTLPGIGQILGLTRLYEIQTIDRLSRVQDFSSYCRLVKAEKRSAGKRLGTTGAKIGNVHLKWAFSEAAVCFLHRNPQRQHYLKRIRRRYGKGKSLSILAAKLGRATYYMLNSNGRSI